MRAKSLRVVWIAALAAASIWCLLGAGCAEPNPEAPTGSEDPLYSGPSGPDWHQPQSQCYLCHAGQHGGYWQAPDQCLDCHELPPGEPIPTIPHGERPDYSCTEAGCHAGIHDGIHNDSQCLACHNF